MPILRSRSARGSLSNHRRRRKQNRSAARRQMANAIQQLENRHLLAFGIELFADINALGLSSSIDSMVEFSGEAYFVADDGRTGSELWKSDGTASGTVQVADLLPGPDGSQPEGLTTMGGDLFFTALDADYEQDLWKVDGTTGGTVLVYDANDDGVYYLKNLTASGGNVFFTAYEYGSGYELWASDGTSAGTALVKDINPDQSIIDGPQELTDVGGTLFFSSYESGYDNRELWKSDGTPGGTVMVKDLAIDNSGMTPDPLISSNPYNLTNVNGTLFFVAEDPIDGVELFTSNGQEAGTFMVKDINTAGSSYPADLTAFDGQVFFSANDGSTGRQLFSSNGTSAGTQMVANTAGGSNPSNPSSMAVVGGELFFAAEGSVAATTITAATPTLLANNSILSGNSQAGIITEVTSGPDRGILGHFGGAGAITARNMGATDDGDGWVLNGKIGDPGVQLTTLAVNDFYMTDIDSGDLANDTWEWTISDAAGLTNIDFSGFASGNEFAESTEGLVFELFLNNSPTRSDVQEINGSALDNWLTPRTADNVDLTVPNGPTLITTATVRMRIGRDLTTDYVAQYSEAILVNAQLTADLSSGTPLRLPVGRELHKTDGTTVGTTLVKDIGVNSGSNPSQLTESGGKLFFSADEVAGTGRELWLSNGSEAGTMLLVDSRPGADSYLAPYDGAPQNLTDVGGTLFFTTIDDTGDRELWSSDGMAANTALVANINIATQSAEVQQLVQVGSLLYFIADDGINGQAVYRADPVAETVTMVADITTTSADLVSGLAKFRNGVVFFNSTSGSSGDVYYYDGTGSAPIQLSSQTPIPFNLEGGLFAESTGEDLLYFVTDDVTNGEELWSSDGSSGGTMMVFDLNQGSTGSNPRSLIEHNGLMHFTADDGYNGRELFYAASSGEGLVLTLDVNPGAGSSDPEELTLSGGRLFFAADDGTNGRELWRANGWSTNHNPVGDSNPTNLTDVNGLLYYAADDGGSGLEPYKSNGTAGGTSKVADIGPLNIGSSPDGFVDVGGTVYFAATESNKGVLIEKFGGITGTTIASLTGAPNYPGSPDSSIIYSTFEAPTNVDENYGLRARGYLTAPATGDYTFWIASDDNGSLLLSSDADPANATEIASVPSWSSSQQYDKFPEQQSATISLVAGQHYYIEALMKEQGGGDNLSVAWAGPDIVGPTIIADEYLTRFGAAAGDQGSGRELWSTDGTPGGTAIVSDLQPGTDSSNPEPESLHWHAFADECDWNWNAGS